MTAQDETRRDIAVDVLKQQGWYEDAEGNLIRPIPEAVFGFTVQVIGYGDDPEKDAIERLIRPLQRYGGAHASRVKVFVHGEQIWPPQ